MRRLSPRSGAGLARVFLAGRILVVTVVSCMKVTLADVPQRSGDNAFQWSFDGNSSVSGHLVHVYGISSKHLSNETDRDLPALRSFRLLPNANHTK